MRLRLFGLVLVMSALGASPETKRIKDFEGRCSVAVPADWAASQQGSARSSDKNISVVVISTAPRFRTLSDIRQFLTATYKNDRITQDSASEIEMEGMSSPGKPNFVRAIPAGGRVCLAEVVYTTGSQKDVRAIAESLSPVQ